MAQFGTGSNRKTTVTGFEITLKLQMDRTRTGSLILHALRLTMGRNTLARSSASTQSARGPSIDLMPDAAAAQAMSEVRRQA